jgi:hypothetical protein
MYEAAVAIRPRRWTDVEADFLKAMWEFDRNFTSGLATQGDNQNGKGDFFTDLIALLLESSTGRPLYGRGAVPGLFFRKHLLDASYPPRGHVELLIETKVAGAPKTGRNPRQKNPLGRPGSSDLKKRITEAGLKTIDLKAEWARLAGEGGGPAGDLISWLRKSKPLCFLFLAVRVVDTRDLQKTIELAHAAEKMMDGVGVIAYEPDTGEDQYRAVPLPTELELDRTLARVATALRSQPP